jgi:predicted hydrolase (HD superfamily)
MRPTGMEGMEVKSIKKKMKDKAFAASVCRDNIRQCAEAGLELDDFLALAIEAMRSHSAELGLNK